MIGAEAYVKDQSGDGNENGNNRAMNGTEDTKVVGCVNFLNVAIYQVSRSSRSISSLPSDSI